MELLLFIDVYKRAFVENASNSTQWDDGTIYLYLGVFFAVVMLGVLIEKNRLRNGHLPIKTKSLFVVEAFLLIFILGLRGENVGSDTIQYRFSFEHALERGSFDDETTEPGYQFLLKILRLIVPSADFFVFIVSFITIYLITSTLWRNRDNINIFAAFSLYIGLFFFQSMNLMRIYLAVAILLFNFHFLIERRYKKYLIIALLTSLIHFSALFMVIMIFFLKVYQYSSKVAVMSFLALLAAAVPFSLVFGDYLTIARYASYAESNESAGGVGLMFIIDYLPCLLLIYYVYKNKIETQWADVLVALTMMGLLTKFISYYIIIAGRLMVHFMPIYLLVVPFFINYIKISNRKLYRQCIIGLSIFIVLKVHLYFKGYLVIDAIMPYDFIWNK